MKRLVNANEVIPDGIERDHVGVVLELLREGVRQMCETTVVHAHRQVSAFDGIAFDTHCGLTTVPLDLEF